MKCSNILWIVLFFVILTQPFTLLAQSEDWRNIQNGNVIPSESYSDQPYVVKTDDGAWLCIMTTGLGHEGDAGQHIISLRSLDRGETWIDKQEVEPADGPEASYAVPLKGPSGRIYVFYNHNTDNVREIEGVDGRIVTRVDSQGYFVFKYSDDHGKSWSQERYTIPVREFEIDRENVYEGDIRFFWNVGKAFEYNGSAYVPLHKVGGFGDGFFTSNEGVLLRSDDLFNVEDPSKAEWVTLPDGDIGLRTPPGGGPIASEQSFSVLSDGSFYVVYRSVDGHPVYSYSRDGGHTWDEPKYKRYANGRLMKNPRAANFAWKVNNGKYLYWFHNHGGEGISYRDRNPVWLSGGIEKNSRDGKIIQWSQPEILLYDDDPIVRMSYPDLIEDQGNYYVTETNKDIARVHKIDESLLKLLWNQFGNQERTEVDLVTSWSNESGVFPQSISAPSFSEFYIRDPTKLDGSGMSINNGFTVDIEFILDELKEGQILLDTRDNTGKGWYLSITEQKTLRMSLSDGRTKSVWNSDKKMLDTNKNHYVSIIVDGGPKIISFVIDGILNDGSDMRQFGWGRFNPYLMSVSATEEIKIGTQLTGIINNVNIYNRAIKISESIGNYKSTLN